MRLNTGNKLFMQNYLLTPESEELEVQMYRVLLET